MRGYGDRVGDSNPDRARSSKVAASAAATGRALERAMPRRRLALAVRAAVSAMAAWLIGNSLPGGLHEYAYAAPLGAFVAVGSTVLTIARGALQQAAGLVLGALLGMAMLWLDIPGVAKVGIIGAFAVLAQSVAILGAGSSFVPVVALLVIIFGGVDADGYAIAYVGQFTIGMAVGVLVNMVLMPPLHDRTARERIRLAGHDLADRADVLAEALRGDWPPSRSDWADWGTELDEAADKLGESVREARESRVMNIRTLWRDHDVRIDETRLAAVRSLVHRMSELLDALAAAAWGEPVVVQLDERERGLAAEAIDALGEHLRAWTEDDDAAGASRRSGERIDALYRASAEREEPESGAGVVVFALRSMRSRIDRAAAGDVTGPLPTVDDEA